MFNDKVKFYISKVKARTNDLNDKFLKLSRALKIISISTFVLLLISIFIFLLRDKPESMIEQASAEFDFVADKDLKPFISFFPILGEDLLLKKIVVNLKQTKKHKYAMGMFEIYLNIKSNSLLQVVKEKEYVIQDALQRELESFSYERLSTIQGKKVVKIILRNRANEALENKAIKRLYFKTFVIQP